MPHKGLRGTVCRRDLSQGGGSPWGKLGGWGRGVLGESQLYSGHAGLDGDEQTQSRTCGMRKRRATEAECGPAWPRHPGPQAAHTGGDGDNHAH